MKQRKSRKLISLLLAAVMVISMVPVSVFATETKPFKVSLADTVFLNSDEDGSVDITTVSPYQGAGSGTISWDAASKTVTMDHVIWEDKSSGGIWLVLFDANDAINYGDTVKVVFKGTNKITGNLLYSLGMNVQITAFDENASISMDTSFGDAIWTQGATLNLGKGNYSIKHTNAQFPAIIANDEGSGINITDGARIEAKSPYCAFYSVGPICVTGNSKITASGAVCAMWCGQGVKIDGGANVTCNSDNGSGIKAKKDIIISSTESSLTVNSKSHALYGGDVTIQDAHASLTSTNGVAVYAGNGNINLKNEKMQAKSTGGHYALYTGKNILIDDKIVPQEEISTDYISPALEHEHSLKSIAGKKPTCTEAGWNDYFQCKYCFKFFEDTACTIEVPDLDKWKGEGGKGYLPAEHKWSEISYKWSDDYTTCTATRVCEIDPKHTETANAEVTSKVTTPVTCTKMGETTYTAVFSEDWAAEQTMTKTIPATGHHYGSEWKSDETNHWHECSCGAKSETAEHSWDAGQVTTPASCTEKGIKTYTCSVCGRTKTEVIPAAGHKFGDWTVTKAATCTEEGMETRTCSVCGATETRAIPKLEPQPTEPKPTEEPTEAPTEEPTEKPTEAPTEKPTEAPTEEPTEAPTEEPTEAPTEEPTEKPTEAPTEAPTEPKPTEPEPTEPEHYENPFTDVKKEDYYEQPIAWAAAKGITVGVTEHTFAPDMYCTREQIVTFLWREAGTPEPKTAKNPFTDVNESDYFYKAVLWAVENGITVGSTETTFSPRAVCTRAQAVTFLWRAAGKPSMEKAKNPFIDLDLKEYYVDAVLWAVEKGITVGATDRTFEPDSTCTRGQIVTFLYRNEH